jgi:hypothetical protein
MTGYIRIINVLLAGLSLLSTACTQKPSEEILQTVEEPVQIPTPAFPLEVIACLAPRDCPGSTLVSWLYNEGTILEYNTEYPATIPPETQLWMSYLWCSIDETTLRDNLEKMKFDLTIDGISYYESLEKEYFTVPTADDLEKKDYCFGAGGAIKGWQAGHTYRIVFGPVLTRELFDGWETFPAESQEHIYILKVDENAELPGNPSQTPAVLPDN